MTYKIFIKKTVLVVSAILLCNHESFSQIDFQKYFKECKQEGSFTLYDLKSKKWSFSNEEDANKETLPASTFKIFNSLIALEEGIVKDENEVYKWDSVERKIKVWNGDTDLKNAFKNSTVWFYVRLAEKIGKEKYQRYLNKCNYGNKDIRNGQGADFWNYGNLGISPIDQIEFLISFYKQRLPFSKRSFEIVKRIMIEEAANNYILRAKTGWTTDEGKDIGWWVGYIEKGKNVYSFATRIFKNTDSPNERFGECRKKITKNILEEMAILP